METEYSFYITLPSNVISTTGVPNTVANYVTKLPQTMHLKGNWEVGLVEISYTLSWYNINRDCEIKLCRYDKDPVIYSGNKLHAGRYDEIEEIIVKMNTEIEKYKTMDPNLVVPVVSYDRHSRKVSIKQGKFNDKGLFLCLEDYMCEKLGLDFCMMKVHLDQEKLEYHDAFPTDTISNYNNEMYIAKRPVELNAGCQSILVYSNLVKPSLVGNVFAPILRLVEVPSESKFGTQITIPYSAPHYHSLAVNEFDTIEIDIKDDTNENIPFEFGRTTIKLHFKQRDKLF